LGVTWTGDLPTLAGPHFAHEELKPKTGHGEAHDNHWWLEGVAGGGAAQSAAQKHKQNPNNEPSFNPQMGAPLLMSGPLPSAPAPTSATRRNVELVAQQARDEPLEELSQVLTSMDVDAAPDYHTTRDRFGVSSRTRRLQREVFRLNQALLKREHAWANRKDQLDQLVVMATNNIARAEASKASSSTAASHHLTTPTPQHPTFLTPAPLLFTFSRLSPLLGLTLPLTD